MNNIFDKLNMVFIKTRKLSWQVLLTIIFILFISLYVNRNVIDFRIDQIMLLKLFIIITVSLFMVELLARGTISWHKSRINILILLFILMMTISLLRSDFFRISLNDYINLLFYFILYFFIRNNITDKIELKSFIKIFFLTSFIVSLYTLIQYYGYDPYLKGLSYLSSTIGQKNWISNYLAMIFPLIFSYFLLEQSKKNKMVYFFLLSILYATLMICQSRGIWISISLTLIFAICIIFRFNLLKIFQKNKKWLFLLLITFLIITVIYSTENPLNKSALTVTERAMSTFDEQDPSINTRLLIWRTTFNMIKDKPILGLGIGTFRMNYLNYQAQLLKESPNYIKYYTKAGEAHNEYLQMWAELGIVGLGLFLLMFYFIYRSVFNFFKRKENAQDKLIVLSLITGITCFMIHSLFTFNLHVPVLGTIFFIIVGLTMKYAKDCSASDNYVTDKMIKKINLNVNSAMKIISFLILSIIMLLLINVLVIKPYIAEIYYYKGIVNNEKGNYIDAASNFEYSAQLDPYNGRILHASGTSYFNLMMYDKGEEILQTAKKYIVDVNTNDNLGLLYSKLKKYPKAEEEFKQAIYLNPKFGKAYYDLGYLYFTQGRYDDTIEQWNKIMEIEPNFPNKHIVLNNLGIVYNKKGMPDEALEYFLEALQLVPEGNPIEKEIEEEINKIYKSKLKN